MTNPDKRLIEIRERIVQARATGAWSSLEYENDIQYLLDHITDLGKKVEELKDNNNAEHLFNEGVLKENASLKKQVEELEKELAFRDVEGNWSGRDWTKILTENKQLQQENASLKEQVEELKKEIVVDEKLLTERERLLAILPCELHGQGCIPGAIEYIEAIKRDFRQLEEINKMINLSCDGKVKVLQARMAKLEEIVGVAKKFRDLVQVHKFTVSLIKVVLTFDDAEDDCPLEIEDLEQFDSLISKLEKGEG